MRLDELNGLDHHRANFVVRLASSRFVSENGSQGGLQGLGEEVDGRAWPDWAASLSRMTKENGGGGDRGGIGEEDSSDGEEVRNAGGVLLVRWVYDERRGRFFVYVVRTASILLCAFSACGCGRRRL